MQGLLGVNGSPSDDGGLEVLGEELTGVSVGGMP